MRILLAAVGRARTGVERRLYEHYAARLAWPLRLKEIELGRTLPPAQQKLKESELLLAAVSEGAKVMALDASGELLTSEALASRLGRWRDDGVGELVCLIGGSHGLAETVLARADLVLALGRVTWPHLLVRGLLAEQLYRAQQILAGHPYHRG
ncbi:MAG: 23S rRNA (pseudouridine(1915)-N(3))-methyltransferase RlmH [Alphaproteobacteria bacterium]